MYRIREARGDRVLAPLDHDTPSTLPLPITTHMNLTQILFAVGVSMTIVVCLYSWIGWRKIIDCYRMWGRRDYWTDFNTVEAIAWWTKGAIIIPGLIFGIQIWQLYFASLATSIALIWASRKKSLPTLVGFNTMWIWLSMMVLAQHLIQ